DLEACEAALAQVSRTGLPVLAGVAAVESVRQAEFLASEVTGVRMPAAILDRLRAASDAAEEGLAVTSEIIQALRGRVQGVHVTGLHGSAAAVERLLTGLSALAR